MTDQRSTVVEPTILENATNRESTASRGYPKLAKLMSAVPETRVFRRFSALALLNILRLQAELQDMEEELKTIIASDASSGNKVREEYSLEFKLMRDYLETEDVAQVSLQHDQIVEIGAKIQEYCMEP
jgi:hypothetical protein